MKSTRLFIATVAVLSPLALTACGDGWVMQRYEGVPYDGRGIDSDEGTAGYGVEYVRANMMPAKGANTEPVTAPPPAQTPPLKDAAPLFDKVQSK